MSFRHFELPRDKLGTYRRAVRLEWLTIAYMVTATVGLYLTLGSSQAMKTAWLEDLLSLIPPIVFLIADRFRDRRPNQRFPYGYHRAVSIAYLPASLSLFAMGSFLFVDSVLKLITAERPSIGTVELLGHQIWLGWLMQVALLWSVVPSVFLGRAKLPLARALHDKVLYADAKMNKANWLTGSAAMVGVFGIGLGLWWADSVAAALISLSILYDGIQNLRIVTADLMDSRPTSIDDRVDPLPVRVENELRKQTWIRDVRARLREEGHVYFGEVFVVPSTEQNLLGNIEQVHQDLRDMDWRLHDVVVTPTRSLEDEDEPSSER